ncbi:39S ribosomal protein L51, mitochondrial [Rhinatrema bivittatum]|uniref:39S ribosomal protein L51, mitochondrial n=1 Tax=Rhinatrema bivittatum TaxID=194408 RepID=UPI00112C31F9|nr:39S ribosomal protein L51, mitochondrial [Rhinatrema bivittatum]XP_029436064.1 39S ribosomal protein L51, mitochondrial [Rhinatrema bivittatum]XP_029436065.1 39S ribosomal protein L51, mitochondrial [Rhinatrema bivittatum]
MARLLQQLSPCLSLLSFLAQSQRTFSLGVMSLIRMEALPKPKQVERWTTKRALFGVYDNVGILGDFKAHPKDMIVGPQWLRGWRGNELQRCIRKKKFVGHRMFAQDLENLNKRIRYLYKRFNRTGKHR